ncbi:MAG: hypothetical protein FWG79_00690 [Bacteroidales bacterium]|nr:hypothetical protein [Bacteroidales bacterium]
MKTTFFISLLLVFSLVSCDRSAFRVSLNGGVFEKKFSFDCGSVEISGAVLSNHQTHASLRFNLDNPVLINPEKLEITHKGEILTAIIDLHERGKARQRMQEARMISGNDGIGIEINRIVHAGDTMKINIDNFILCHDKPLEIGDINLIFVVR